MPTLLNNLDMQNNQAVNLELEQLATPPASPTTGRTYFDTTMQAVRVYSGTQWITASGIREGRAVISGGATQLQIPGVQPSTVATLALNANRLYYAPFILTQPITIDQLALEIVAAVSGGKVRVGMYYADTNWQPTSLVVDAGDFSTTTATAVTATVSAALVPARYLLCWLSDSAPTLRIVRGGFTPIAPALGTSPLIKSFYITGQTYGALPSTGVAWTTVTVGTVAYEHAVFMRESVP